MFSARLPWFFNFFSQSLTRMVIQATTGWPPPCSSSCAETPSARCGYCSGCRLCSRPHSSGQPGFTLLSVLPTHVLNHLATREFVMFKWKCVRQDDVTQIRAFRDLYTVLLSSLVVVSLLKSPDDCRGRSTSPWQWPSRESLQFTGARLTMWRCCWKLRFLWSTLPSGWQDSPHLR